MSRDIVPTNGTSINVITQGTKLVGKISTDTDFRVDGQVEGDIISKGKVVIGQNGLLKGSVSCTNAEIVGTIVGNLQISDTLTLRSSAQINGDVKTKSLVVEPNAVFNGTCSMREVAGTNQKV